MRTTLTATLTLTLLALLAPGAHAGLEDLTHTKDGPCPIAWRRPYYEAGDVAPVVRLIRCAVRRWVVPGGVGKALDVADCESGFRPDAYGNGNGGVFQHRLPYWGSRAASLLRDSWGIGGSWRNARANVIVAIRYAHRLGWAAWTCAGRTNG